MSDNERSFHSYDERDSLLSVERRWSPKRSDFAYSNDSLLSDRFTPQNDGFLSDRLTPQNDGFLSDRLTPQNVGSLSETFMPPNDDTSIILDRFTSTPDPDRKSVFSFTNDIPPGKQQSKGKPDSKENLINFVKRKKRKKKSGISLYYGIIDGLDLSVGARQVIGSMMALCIACGYSLSVQARCICWLIIPIFFGKTGRAYVMTFAISFLIAGPIQNIMINGKEVTRSITCATELVVNHSVTKWGLRMKPLTNIRKTVNEDKMKERTRKVDGYAKGSRGNRVSSIESRNTISKDTEKEEKAERIYRKKSEYQCEDVWNKAVLECRRKFQSLERDCLRKIPVLGYILCLPLKLTIFCELVRAVPGAVGMSCDSIDVVNPGFGETYVRSEETVTELDEGFDVNLQYKLVKSPEEIDYTTADEVRQKTIKEFEKKQVLMQFVLTLMKRVLAFTFILVFISAYKYNKMYLTDFRYDNIYISSYFRRIDARRHADGKFVLLPLKKAEKSGVIFPTSFKLMKTEKRKLTKQTFMLITRVLISWVIIASDRLLYNVMDIISRHSRIDYRQQGIHHIKIDVFGRGFMSDIVRIFLQGFNTKENIDHVSTNFECLPRPKEMDSKYVGLIFGVYGLVWFLMLTEAYGLRLRRLREKRRILFLYNDMLKKRRGFLRHMRHTVRKQARRQALSVKTTVFYALSQEFPRLCGCLKKFQSAKLYCLICGDPENKFFRKCETPDCHFGYCEECWYDVKGRCYACIPFDDDDDESELTDDDIIT
ncbi:hypothetical protein KUTeg_015763 [Tegillarca granosa]|uniref:Dendritic cell-specific transmembrane protein-like domain-containing protein n=1 Tax=Tegillarca granosa TaxID=220873 RepID=A0ABQ9ERZ8_TEGGR|nr:hypothetical protein KUTeg_015763 [Tegillarca granosa]